VRSSFRRCFRDTIKRFVIAEEVRAGKHRFAAETWDEYPSMYVSTAYPKEQWAFVPKNLAMPAMVAAVSLLEK
jgi:hypothetical protein